VRAASGPHARAGVSYADRRVAGDAVSQHGLNVKKPMYYANSLPNQPTSN